MFDPVLMQLVRLPDQASSRTGVLLVALVQTAVVGLVLLDRYRATHAKRASRRPGRDSQGLYNSATLLLASIAVIGLGEVLLISSVGNTTMGSGLMLAAAPIMLVAAIRLPGVDRAPRERTRLMVDGLMILAAAATFAWYFLIGPVLGHHWPSTETKLISLAHPIADILLVGALLVVSAKSDRLPEGRSWPLAAGIAIMIVADSIQQFGLVTGTPIQAAVPEFVRTAGTILLGFTALTFMRAHTGDQSGPAGRTAVPASTNHNGATVWEAARVWDSLLPYALVPASAALVAYAWQRQLSSSLTGGVVCGTLTLVALAFFRQVLSIKENMRLYQQVASAYQDSLTHSASMRTLNDELEQTKDKLQARNNALSLTNLSLHAEATTDPVTALPNHRSMVSAIDAELERAFRYGRSCSLLFLDLDHFKALNDSCGHLAGDAILREMVTPILEGLRAADVAGRWGGEEFVVMLPETEIGEAITAAERIRRLVSEYQFPIAGGVHLTCSIGVAAFPYDADTRDKLIESADQAMYAAKQLGRNQVRAAVDPSVVAFLSDIRRSSSREETTLWGIVEALTTIVKAHDAAEDAQSQEVAQMSMRIAGSLGLSGAEVRVIGLAARLHDIGMVSVPQAVLHKPTPLDPDDWTSVHSHPRIGADVVARVPPLSPLSPLIRSHHERWDGTGYPDGLRGEEIPIGARIIAACGAYVAMTHGSARSKPRTMTEALREMNECSGSQFDPQVVQRLEQVLFDQMPGPALKAG